MENKNYTIKDIARMAGVSAGTVDRVLHNRGDVSAASREKVQKVLDEIDYHPNMFAIGLAAKKRYRVLCIIPYYVEPKLSAVSHQTYKMGETACQLLIDQIKGDRTVKQVVIPTHLQIRESSIKEK